MSKFGFGTSSEQQLYTVKTSLGRLCRHALDLSPIDFGVRQGRRTEEEQRENVAKGVSQTMNSKHLPDVTDGLASAIDFIPYWKGAYRDSWPFVIPVANAFMQASKDLDIQVISGAAWGMDLWSFRHIGEAMEAYILLKGSRDGKVFHDGFHIELAGNVDEKVTYEV